MEIDRKSFLASLGGRATLNRMSDEAKADALEDQMLFELSQASASARSGEGGHEFPTAAEVDVQVETLPYRRGVGSLFVNPRGNVKKLPPMPPPRRLWISSPCASRGPPITCCKARISRRETACRRKSFWPVCCTTPYRP